MAAVWGTDVYTDDSSLCRAALHAGVISPQGGSITVNRTAGRPLYVGTTRNGVRSNDFSGFPNSIEFKGAAPPPPGPGLCPGSLGINRELPTPFTCRCTRAGDAGGRRLGNRYLHGRLVALPGGAARRPRHAPGRNDHRRARRRTPALRRLDAQRRRVERFRGVPEQHYVSLDTVSRVLGRSTAVTSKVLGDHGFQGAWRHGFQGAACAAPWSVLVAQHVTVLLTRAR